MEMYTAESGDTHLPEQDHEDLRGLAPNHHVLLSRPSSWITDCMTDC